jgi:hypothetical protein
MEDILIPFIPMTLFLCAAAVAIFRPISKRLGNIMELHYKEKISQQAEESTQAELKMLLVSLDKRLELMEQRLEFTESLIESKSHRELPEYR